jgi:glutamate/aspartate transport system substrate-binding protein
MPAARTPCPPRRPSPRRLLCISLGALLCLPRPAAAQESPVLLKLRDTGIVTIGYRANSPPFSYLDADLKPVGYSIDLCRHVVNELRQRPGLALLEMRMVSVTSATRLPLVANGTVDMECGVTTNTAERQKTQTFSVTMFVAESRLLSKKSEDIRTLDALQGKAVASTIGTTSIQVLQAANASRGLGMRILAGLDDAESFRLLESGLVSAFAMDDVLLRSLLATARSPADFTISDAALSVEPYAIGLSRRDPAFKRLVDDALTRLFVSGEIRAIYQRWFQRPIPPRGVNLQLPMSAALERAIRQPTDSPDPQRYR